MVQDDGEVTPADHLDCIFPSKHFYWPDEARSGEGAGLGPASALVDFAEEYGGTSLGRHTTMPAAPLFIVEIPSAGENGEAGVMWLEVAS